MQPADEAALSSTRKRLCEQQWANPGVAFPMHVAGWIDCEWWRLKYEGMKAEKLPTFPENHLQAQRGRSVVPKPKKPRRPRKRK